MVNNKQAINVSRTEMRTAVLLVTVLSSIIIIDTAHHYWQVVAYWTVETDSHPSAAVLRSPVRRRPRCRSTARFADTSV